MIRVTIEREADGCIRAFTMEGHAHFAKRGEDIVCAGASAVSFGTINAIEELTGVRLNVSLGQDGGYLRCELPELEEAATAEKVQLLLKAMVVSLKTIERDYGKFIRVTWK
ncbi:ribosomal-processing cysteine protease Prp [Geobacillus stearothermophilus]|uniref:ribosomal-processing cysteine protease Prp n=1 Tax=Geobacillus stearothermophilus TaxID=1422 RepID=UPI001F40A8E6|nr:ribosomal-processing cysteine protease Prp [Geobacillus stearothermophilus]MCK7607045.1 ribosomal-processing cysteine protease Prp [Geobacillus stearothermophilus]